MALLFFDGFDTYETLADLNRYIVTGTPSLFKTTGRSGKGRYAISLTAASQGLSLPLSAPSGALTAGFCVQRIRTVTSTPSFYYSVLNSATRAPQITVEWNSTGFVNLYRGSKSTTSVIAQTASVVPIDGPWQYVEVQSVIHPTAGSVTVRFGGRNVIAVENVNTQGDTSAARGDVIHFAASSTTHVDDLYVCDASGAAPTNNFLGVCSIRYRTPTGAGEFSQFTPLTTGRPNYLMVTTSDRDYSYNSASTAGLKDTFTSTENPLLATENVLGVKVAVVAKKDDNIDRAMQTVLRSGGAEANGSTKTLTQTYEAFSDIFLINPATNKPWTPQAANAFHFGYKIVR